MGRQRETGLNHTQVRTSQMNVQRSCHVALFGSSLREAVAARTPRPATAARENADVAVKTGGATWVASAIVIVFSFVRLSMEWATGERQGWCL